MATASEIRAWVESTRPTDWYGKCAGLTDRVVAAFTGGSRQWYDSATDARDASGPLNGDASKCPPGGIHYWSYYGTAWDGSRGDWGHVTIDIYGGGGSTLSATGHAYEYWGVNAGLISVASQSQRAGMRYLGWSRTYGAASPLTITTGSVAGGEATPLNQEDDDMLMIKLKGAQNDHLVALGEGVFRHFLPSDPYELVKNVSRSADDWQEVNIADLPALLRTYGCDLNIWDFRDSRDLSKSLPGGDVNAVFCILDPLDGSVKPGNMWSSAGATRQAIADLSKSLAK